MPCVIGFKVPFGAQSASFEVEKSTPDPVTAENMEVLALVGEGDAANLAEKVECLFGLKGLCIDDIDVVCLLGCHQHPLPGPNW